MKLNDYIQFRKYSVKYAGTIDFNHSSNDPTYNNPANNQQPDYSSVRTAGGDIDASNINWGNTQYTYKPTSGQMQQGQQIWSTLNNGENVPQQIQNKWNEMKDTAAKADLIRWYMGGGAVDNDLSYTTVSPSYDQGINMYNPGDVVHPAHGENITLANNASLATAGHEHGHDFRHSKMGPNYYRLPTLKQEYDASFGALPQGMRQLLSDDPGLFQRFINYTNQRLKPAYNAHISHAQYVNAEPGKSKLLGEQNKQYADQVQSMAEDPQWANMDNNMFEQLRQHAIKHDYNPKAGWWNDPRYAQPPEQVFTDNTPKRWYEEQDLNYARQDPTILNMKNDAIPEPEAPKKPWYRRWYDSAVDYFK